ncbi:CNK3/IPCEF1 fusion protein isoform X2 [Planococcus citri]|uniref:CNK3/IPCEF1 fusion protein isoform X2 n=1 Tax=Planococcus citri TaxID=170843 RepID=UPI0031F93B00
MAYVNVADWKPEQVAEWLKGLDNVVLQYIRLFVEKNINGQQLLDLQPNDLEEIGVYKIGHQEIILEAIDLLKNFYYDLDRENLQLLALRLSCLAHSLHNELWRNHINSSVVSTQVLADVANVVSAVKPLVCWLDRSPFCDQSSYVDTKTELLKLSLEMAMSGMRDRFVDKPIEYIRQSSKQLAELVDKIIQSIDDSLLLQPASLDLATLKKRPGDHLGFYIVPSFHGILQVGELKCNSAAHQSGKIETGDEIVQINYQTVVGWEVKEVMSLLFEETSTEILMTLKKRPRHSKVFGQIYIKPYRLPCRKQINYSTKWNDLLSPSRPELLTVPPHFGLQFKILNSKPIANTVETQVADRVSPPSPTPSTVSSSSSQSSESELMVGPSSPNSVRLYLPKPRIPVQRRATITGASPVSKQAPLSLEQFWHELKLEKEWRSNSDEKACEKANSETHLRRSPPAAHCSLTWSARLCEQMDSSVSDSSSSEKTPKPDKENADGNSFIPLKQRIDSLNKAIEQTSQNAKKPKLFPKPILSNAQNTVAKMESSSKPSSPLRSNMAKKNDRSPRRERGKLDKSYSTPSYDYSADSKEPLTFNMKLPEEKVKSAPDNITSESDSLSEFKKSLDMKPFTKPIKQDSLEIESEQNEYLEIRSDGVVEPELTESSASLPSEQELSSNKNKILDTIDSSLMIMDSESEANSLSEESPKLRPPLERSIPVQEIRPESNIFDREPKNELNDLPHDGIPKQIINSPISPTEKLVIHTTIDVPATFPRHKIDKKPISPPEPPPRPLKNAASHSKANQKAVSVTKSASRNISHKSPKVPRKKNPLLAKRRNVSVKELGTCDHEGTLYHRARKNNRESPHWIKGWFIIKGTIFYGFNSRDASHARLMISLPGFTVSPAEEVKSKNFAFKVYHTGTTFYFAAESGEDLAGWVDSFSKVTVSEEEQTIVMSETDGEEDESPTITTKKDKSGHEHGPHVAAKKIFSVISGHLSHTQDNKGDKKFNSLKKPSRKLAKEESSDGNHVSSLDRKYRKLFPVGSKQSIVAVPTAQFRSYRRIPPMEKPPAQLPEPSLSLDSNRPESLTCTAPMPSASPTRPPDMADYRLASLAKCNANNQRDLSLNNNKNTRGFSTWWLYDSGILHAESTGRREETTTTAPTATTTSSSCNEHFTGTPVPCSPTSHTHSQPQCCCCYWS